MKRKFSFIALSTVTAIGVVGCTAQLWKVTYPGATSFYSREYGLVLTQNTNPLLIGRFEDENREGSLFVAQYDSDGKLIWKHEEPDDIRLESSLAYIDDVATDNHGGVFFSSYDDLLDSEATLTKLANDGSVLWQDTFHSSIAIHTVAINDTQHYIAGNFDGIFGLRAYDAQGQLIWEYEEAADSGDGGLAEELANPDNDQGSAGLGLEDYLNNDPRGTGVFTSSSRSGNPQASTLSFQLLLIRFDDYGNIFLGTTDRLRKITPNGDLSLSVSAEGIGFDRFADFDIRNGQLGIIGQFEASPKVALLDSDLNLLRAADFATDLPGHRVAMFDANSFCFSINRYDEGVKQIRTIGTFSLEAGIINLNELQIEEDYYFIPVDLETDGNDCYFASSRSASNQSVNSFIEVFDREASLQATIKIDDFLGSAMEINGPNSYTAGITGPYDGIQGTFATLFKHKTQ